MSTSPRRSILGPRFKRILHVIRSPYEQISSFATHTNQSYEFAIQCVKAWRNLIVFSNEVDSNGLTFVSSRHDKSCKRGARCNLPVSAHQWLSWNSFISTIADSTYRLEDEREKLISDAITYMKDHRYDEDCISKLKRITWHPRGVLEPSKHHKGHARYGRDDIEKDVGVQMMYAIDKLAVRFGYLLNGNNLPNEESGKLQIRHGETLLTKEL